MNACVAISSGLLGSPFTFRHVEFGRIFVLNKEKKRTKTQDDRQKKKKKKKEGEWKSMKAQNKYMYVNK